MESSGNLHPGIRADQIAVGGGGVGLIFVASTVYTFFVGIPELRWFLAAAIAVGPIFSIALTVFHKRNPTKIPTLFSR